MKSQLGESSATASQRRVPPRSAPRRPSSPRRAPGSDAPGLLRRIERVYRVLCSGLLFLSFGVGAVMLAGLVLPVIAAIGRDDRGRRALRAQRMIHHGFRLFIWMGTVSGVWRARIDGAAHLRERGSLVVANHPTLIDVVILMAHMPQADCVVKREAWSNPFLRGIVRAADYIPNDGGEDLVDACSERLRAGRSVLLFPEGSRSPQAGLGPFKRGAARVALSSGCPVTPVMISCVPPALKKGQPWYALPNRRFEYRLSVGAPMDAAALAGGVPATSATTSGLAARRATATLRAWFEERGLAGAERGRSGELEENRPGKLGTDESGADEFRADEFRVDEFRADEVGIDSATDALDRGAKLSSVAHREPGAEARTDERSS